MGEVVWRNRLLESFLINCTRFALLVAYFNLINHVCGLVCFASAMHCIITSI